MIFSKKTVPIYRYDKKYNVWIVFYQNDELGVVGQGDTKQEALFVLKRDLKIATKLSRERKRFYFLINLLKKFFLEKTIF